MEGIQFTPGISPMRPGASGAARTLGGRLDAPAATDSPKGTGFREVLVRALESVNEAQLRAEEAGMRLAAGDAVELHEVMIAAEQAALTLELTLALQRKFVEAYQEISRMQI